MTALAHPSHARADQTGFLQAAGLEVTHASGDRVEGFIALGP
jgi:hypothetical protein